MRLRFIHKIKLSVPVLFLATGILFSCVNDLETIKKVSYKSTDPDERTRDLHVLYTDSGYAKIEVDATLAETYSKPEPVIKFMHIIDYSAYSGKLPHLPGKFRIGGSKHMGLPGGIFNAILIKYIHNG